MCIKLKDIIPRQNFEIAVQAYDSSFTGHVVGAGKSLSPIGQAPTIVLCRSVDLFFAMSMFSVFLDFPIQPEWFST